MLRAPADDADDDGLEDALLTIGITIDNHPPYFAFSSQDHQMKTVMIAGGQDNDGDGEEVMNYSLDNNPRSLLLVET